MGDAEHFHFGNATEEGVDHCGWVVGHFMKPDDVRRSSDVEIKWGVHRAGEERATWQEIEQRTTVLILISGRFEITLDAGSFMLEKSGDYVMWGHGIGHSWRAHEDSVMLTVRWPSQP